MEVWAFASPTNHPLMRAWRDEFRTALQRGLRAYSDSLPQEVVGAQLRPNLPYMAICAAYRQVQLQHTLHEALRSVLPPYGGGREKKNGRREECVCGWVGGGRQGVEG